MVAGGEHVDHGHPGVAGQLSDELVGSGADPDRGGVPESTYAVSRTDSPRLSWSSSGRSTIG